MYYLCFWRKKEYFCIARFGSYQTSFLGSMILNRDNAHMKSMKLSNFQDFPPPLSIYVQNSSTPLTFDVSFKRSPPPPFNDNQSNKRKQSKNDYYMLSGPSFRWAFVLSISSLILSGFPLTSFHLTEASLSTFLWLYVLVWAAVKKKYHEMSFICN